MHTKRKFVLLVAGLALATPSMFAAALVNDGKFGVVIVSRERIVEVPTTDYGNLHCTGLEFQGPSKSIFIIKGESDRGFSGGMIYEKNDKDSAVLFAPNSVWGGIFAHEEQGIDDATIRVRIAVASICQLSLYHNE